MSYKKALEILKALPVEEQVLAAGTYKFYEDGKAQCGCAIGKILPSFYAGLTEGDSLRGEGIMRILFSMGHSLPSERRVQLLKNFKEDLVLSQVTVEEARKLQRINDTFESFRDSRTHEPVSQQLFTIHEELNPNINSRSTRERRFKHIVKFMETQENEASTTSTP